MIPKILHLCWLSGDEYSPLIAKCIQSWKEKCPDYEVRIWNTKNFDISSSAWVSEAFNKKKYAFAADYIRLWAVYNYGGIYLDSDVEVIKTFDDLLHLNSFMGFALDGNYEPAIFGAIPKQEWLQKCLCHYNNRHFIKTDGTLDMLTLPYVIKPILKKEYGMEPKNLRDKINFVADANIKLFPYDFFSPDIINMRITLNTYTVHHFTGYWGTPAYKFRKRVFRFIAKNKLMFFIYSNTYQRLKKWIQKIFFKREYIPYKYQ